MHHVLSLGGLFLSLHLLFFSVIPIKFPIITIIQYLLLSIILEIQDGFGQRRTLMCDLTFLAPSWESESWLRNRVWPCETNELVVARSVSVPVLVLAIVATYYSCLTTCACAMRLTMCIALVPWKTRLLFQNYSHFSPFPIILKIVPEQSAQAYHMYA